MDLKELLLHKLTLQIGNGVICFLTAHAVALFGAPYVQTLLQNVFVDPTIKPGAQEFIRAAIGTVIVAGGQVAFHFVHEKFITPTASPKINPVSIQGVQP